MNYQMNVTKYQPSNICRRFSNKKLVEFVNSMFKTYYSDILRENY